MPKDDIRITGRFGGHNVDLTIQCGEQDSSDTPTSPVDTPVDTPAPDEVKPIEEPTVGVETSAEGEVVSPGEPAPPQIDGDTAPESDPAPPVTQVDEDEAPNPAGNAEQL